MSDENENEQAQTPQTSPFDAIRHVDDHGDYWSARELSKLLSYTEYGKFQGVLTKAQIACETSGYAISDHFARVSDMIQTGKGARRKVENMKLSRYACYLVVQNGDPDKPIVAMGANLLCGPDA